jgi:hypothetical protein
MGASSTITIYLATKQVTFSAPVMALRENVAVALVNADASTPSDLILSVMWRSTALVQCDSFVAGVGQIDGTLDLDDSNLEAYFSGRAGQYKRTFDLTLWDNGRMKMLINDKITIMNNPYDPGMTLPTAI